MRRPRHISFHTRAAGAYARNQAAKAATNFTPAKAAIEPHEGNPSDADKLSAGVIPSPEDLSAADARTVGGAFLETIRREQAKRQSAKPEPPTIDV
jgi:hypothetical protein